MIETGSPVWYERDGRPCDRAVTQVNAHTATYSYRDTCRRCGGAGGGAQWAHTGWTCYECGGVKLGRMLTVKVYSAEKLAKLNATRETVRERREVKQRAAAEARAAADSAALAEWREQNAEFLVALRAAAGRSDFLYSLLEQATRRPLTPAQVEAGRAACEREQAKAEREAQQIEPPAGRQTVEAVVISTKSVETPYGDTRKMLVDVGGKYRLFGTVPRIQWGAEGWRGDLCGLRVRFTATIEPREVGFGFFSRPTGAVEIEAGS